LKGKNIPAKKRFLEAPIHAVLGAGILILLSAVSLAAILCPRRKADGYIADIYQNGSLIESIPLSHIRTPYVLTVTGETGCVNEIEVCPGSIRMLSADCPDKLCVRQGFISDSQLPITCLPNRVVILLRPEEAPEEAASITPDIITY